MDRDDEHLKLLAISSFIVPALPIVKARFDAAESQTQPRGAS